jgi:hypothetical protein
MVTKGLPVLSYLKNTLPKFISIILSPYFLSSHLPLHFPFPLTCSLIVWLLVDGARGKRGRASEEPCVSTLMEKSREKFHVQLPEWF